MRLTPEDPQYQALVRDLRSKHPDPLDRILVLTAVLQREPDLILTDLLVGSVEEYATWIRSCEAGTIIPSARKLLQTPNPPNPDITPLFGCYEDPDLSEF